MIETPKGEAIEDIERIHRAGFARGQELGVFCLGMYQRAQREVTPNQERIGYVEMNSSGRMDLAANEEGLLATSSLGGCTGVAGFAKRKDGSMATFISHYDPLSQSGILTGEPSPASSDMYRFCNEVSDEDLDGDRCYVVAYADVEHSNPGHGKRVGQFKQWHYVDQLDTTATQLGAKSKVIFLPYKFNDKGHNLATGRDANTEGIFWNGYKIDIDDLLKSSPADKVSL